MLEVNKGEISILVFEYALTKRELEILIQMLKCQSCKTMSENLFISIHTVKSHRKNILKKLGCKNVSELIHWFIRFRENVLQSDEMAKLTPQSDKTHSKE
jgi:DNA-binding CsgD family transcriptional regulator